MPSLISITPILIFLALCYALLCTASPYGACRRCKGWGHKIHQTRAGRLKRGRQCRRCAGYGRRLRIGRRVYNGAARLHHDDTR
ncbi:hypothetical protein ACFXCZ_26320 [Streptomyces sp. NPDC059396]|uniref:hypothetical protein n=1 Tax=Streptomyces sp. NPDC059396 TaxID=3346819 RepID=UPI00368145AB